MGQIVRDGTGNASLNRAVEGLIVLAAAIEAVMLAALVLLAGGIGAGSTFITAVLRFDALLTRPFLVFPFLNRLPITSSWRQVVAVAGYGIVFTVAIGALAWWERRQTLF